MGEVPAPPFTGATDAVIIGRVLTGRGVGGGAPTFVGGFAGEVRIGFGLIGG